jgi:filamentous hemagglutinin family protein
MKHISHLHRSSRRTGRTATTKFVLKALPVAVALCFCPVVWADINANIAGLPRGGTVTYTNGTVQSNVTDSQLTVTQTGSRAVIDWQSFNINTGKTVHFAQDGTTAAVLNRVPAGAGLSEIYGTLTANGMVLLMNPNGVLFGSGAQINVGSLIATTGIVNQTGFTGGGGAFAISGAISGSVTNQGTITAQNAGLVALVAPSISNQGIITATGGRIALSGADRATVSLNNNLYEFAVDAGASGTNASISNAAAARLDGATIFMSTGDAASLLSGVINLEGVQQASSAIVVNGNTVVLKSDLNATTISGSSNTINVHPGASIQDAVKIAKTGTPGAGATVNVQAGTFNEVLTLDKANLTVSGQANARLQVADNTNGITIAANSVTVAGLELAGPVTSSYLNYAWGSNVSRGIVVGRGVTGFAIRNNNIHDVRNGILINGISNTGSVTSNRIENTKSGISVQYTDAVGVAISGNTEGPIGNEWGLNLHLNGVWIPVTDTINPNTDPYMQNAPTLTWQQSLLALSTANAGWGVQDQAYKSSNRTQVAVATTGGASNQGSRLTPINTIQGGVNAAVTGGKVNVAAGTYAENVSITKALSLAGAGAGQSIIRPASGDAVAVSGTIGAGSTVLVDGFTLREAPGAGVSVASGTTLGQLTIQNSDFLNNGHFGFTADGSTTAGIPGLANVSLLNSTFEGNGAPYTSAASLGQGDIHFNYYNGNATLRNITITGNTEHTGIHFRGYHNASGGAVHDAGAVVFDNVTIGGSFRRPSGSAGTWNPSGPGDAIHFLEYGSVANVSFNNVVINPTVGHGLFLEGLSSTLNIGNTRLGVPDRSITGTGIAPTWSYNIVSGSNDQNNVRTNVNATRAVFTGAASGFDIEDRVAHALDVSGLGLVTWNAGNVYVTQASGSIQRGLDAVSAGGTVNVSSGTFAESVALNSPYNLRFNDTTVHSLTFNAGAAGAGIGGKVTADTSTGFAFSAPISLLADTALVTNGANITLSGDVQNAGSTSYGLTLTTGAGSSRGDVSMVSGGSESNPLGQLVVSSNRFNLHDTLWVKSYKIDALGDVALSGHTLRGQDADATNTMNAGGNVTGSTVSVGTVQISSGGDISANVSGRDVTVSSQGDLNVTVTATNSATLHGDSVAATVTGRDVTVTSHSDMNVGVTATNSASLIGDTVVATVTAPVVGVDSAHDAQISGSSSNITVDAPGGRVSGNFAKITNEGSGLVKVNGRPQGNSTLIANAENNRVIPAGNPLAGRTEPYAWAAIRAAQSSGLTAQGMADRRLSAPVAAGRFIDRGQSVELDLSPRNESRQP